MEEYPKKYVVLCMVKPGISFGEYEDIEKILGYYVSSAHLIEKLDNNDGYVVSVPDYPKFTKNSILVNGCIVNKIYDNKKDAVRDREMLNDKLVNDKMINAYKAYSKNLIDRNDLVRTRIDAYNDLSNCEEYEFELDAMEIEKDLKKRKIENI